MIGPEYPAYERLKGYFPKQILLKIEPSLSYADAKEKLNAFINGILSQENFRGSKIQLI